MKKLNKITKELKTAIIMYYDEDLQEPRRVIFGEVDDLLLLLEENALILYERLKKLEKKNTKTPKEFVKAIRQTKPKEFTSHGETATEDNGRLLLSYEVIKK